MIKDVDLKKRHLENSMLFIDPALKSFLENERREAQRGNIRNLQAMKEKAETSYFNRIMVLLKKKKINQRGLPKFVQIATVKLKMLQ